MGGREGGRRDRGNCPCGAGAAGRQKGTEAADGPSPRQQTASRDWVSCAALFPEETQTNRPQTPAEPAGAEGLRTSSWKRRGQRRGRNAPRARGAGAGVHSKGPCLRLETPVPFIHPAAAEDTGDTSEPARLTSAWGSAWGEQAEPQVPAVTPPDGGRMLGGRAEHRRLLGKTAKKREKMILATILTNRKRKRKPYLGHT